MARKLLCFTLLLAEICAAGSAAPKPAPKSGGYRDEAMIARVVLKYRSFKTLSQTVTGTMNIKAQGVDMKADFLYTVQLAQPNKVRVASEVTFMGKKHKGTFVSNGTTAWQWNEDTKEFSEALLGDAAKDKNKYSDWLIDQIGPDLVNIFFLEAAGGDIVNVGKDAEKSIVIKDYPTTQMDGRPTWVIPIKISEKGAPPTTATLYADASDSMTRRYRMTVVPPPDKDTPQGTTVNMVFFYSKIKPDEEIPDATFTFTPPEGAKKADKVPSAFDRAFGD